MVAVRGVFYKTVISVLGYVSLLHGRVPPPSQHREHAHLWLRSWGKVEGNC